ncbi:MAG: SagB/ThcOx family dehydrogenase [Candidatus Heimdallarchaeota archaeon]|nr:SagB/ThcOx family dehydrogenase [Candidatus Heimdallarchaeota archaeon]
MNTKNKKKWVLIGFFLIFGSLIISIPIVLFNQRFIQKVTLPQPDNQGEIMLEEALAIVNQSRELLPEKEMTLQEVGQLLWSMQGITHGRYRTVPSAGATYPLEVYVVTYSVTNLPQGLYHYLPKSHELEIINDKMITREEITEQCYSNQIAIETAQIIIFITAIPERTTRIYGDRGIRYVNLEIGHVLGNVHLQAVTTNSHIDLITQYNDSGLQQITEIKEDIEIILPITCCSSYQLKGLPNNLTEIIGTEDITNRLTVEEAIYLRKSIRSYQSNEISLQKIKRLIFFAFTNKRLFDSESYSNPKILPVNALSLFLFSSEQNSNLSTGIYQIDKQSLNFTLIKSGDYTQSLYEAGLSQAWIQTAQSNIVSFLNETKLATLKQNNSLQMGLFQTGIIAQYLYLESRNLDLGMVVVGAFYDNAVRSIINLDNSQMPNYIIPLGIAELSSTDQQLIFMNKIQISKIFGYLTLGFLYLTCFISTPLLKTKIKSHWLKIHHIFSTGFSIAFILSHVLLLVNILSSLESTSFFDGLKTIVLELVGYNIYPIDSVYKLGLLTSLIAFWLIIAMNINSYIIYRFKLFSSKTRRIIHQTQTVILLLLIFIHVYGNCLTQKVHFWSFMVVNLIIIAAFFGCYFYQEIKNWYHNDKQISS